MYETDTGVGGGVYLGQQTLTVPASSTLVIPYGAFIMVPVTGITVQLLIGTTWTTVSPLNPVKSDGGALQFSNSTTVAINVTLIAVNLEA